MFDRYHEITVIFVLIGRIKILETWTELLRVSSGGIEAMEFWMAHCANILSGK